MALTKPVIALTVGDPGGIGPEIVLKALLNPRVYDWCRPVVVGNGDILQFYRDSLALPVVIDEIDHPYVGNLEPGHVAWITSGSMLVQPVRPGVAAADYAQMVLQDMRQAVHLALAGSVQAVIAGPHTKKSMELAGIDFDGYPRYLASLTQTPWDRTFLMLVGGGLRMVNTTLHIALNEVAHQLHQNLVLAAIRAASRAVQPAALVTPRIAVAGLNPHAGEGGMFGWEERDVIEPAILAAQAEGIQAAGPFPSDSWLSGERYDAYVAMYHDQAHIPMKILARNQISAFTIGTPVLFSTVGHGSALAIAGQGIAHPDSVVATLQRVSSHCG